jgi:hypothetical protein
MNAPSVCQPQEANSVTKLAQWVALWIMIPQEQDQTMGPDKLEANLIALGESISVQGADG